MKRIFLVLTMLIVALPGFSQTESRVAFKSNLGLLAVPAHFTDKEVAKSVATLSLKMKKPIQAVETSPIKKSDSETPEANFEIAFGAGNFGTKNNDASGSLNLSPTISLVNGALYFAGDWYVSTSSSLSMGVGASVGVDPLSFWNSSRTFPIRPTLGYRYYKLGTPSLNEQVDNYRSLDREAKGIVYGFRAPLSNGAQENVSFYVEVSELKAVDRGNNLYAFGKAQGANLDYEEVTLRRKVRVYSAGLRWKF